MRRTLVFRADAGPEIGLGHFMRSLAVAEMLKEDFPMVFFTTSPSEFQVREMSAIVDQWYPLAGDNSHFDEFLGRLQGDEVVILDNYFFDTEYQRKIRGKGCLLVCIDDLADRHFVADAVINHAGGIRPEDYSCEAYTRLFLGMKYAMLRSVFRGGAGALDRKSDQVLISLGGSIQDDLLFRLLNALADTSAALRYHVAGIVSEELAASFRNDHRFEFLGRLDSLAMHEEMARSAVGLFPASTLALEAISSRLPSIVGYTAVNQKYLYKGLMEGRVVSAMGDLREIDADELARALVFLWQDGWARQRLEEAMNQAMDTETPGRFRDLFKTLVHE
ncbi:MAG TPA: hypothetical protein P5550_00515 [Bacteroidales bacterium]|nr:hypothetical protein [Bacteroidales bacterium]